MDAFLRSRGLCRKRIAKDGSCLFRAVAEQVFHSQSEHFGVRKACVSYLRRNRENFEAFIEGSFEEYLRHLENPQEWVGEVEISALSLMYKHDFVIYQEPDAPPSYVTENGFPDKVQLCFSNGNHYDLVYEKQFTNAAALCQSILYEMLYEKVLSVEVGDVIYELSTNDGKISEAAEEHLNSSGESDIEDDVSQSCILSTNHVRNLTAGGASGERKGDDPSELLKMLKLKIEEKLKMMIFLSLLLLIWDQEKFESHEKADHKIRVNISPDPGQKKKKREEKLFKNKNKKTHVVCGDSGDWLPREHGRQQLLQVLKMRVKENDLSQARKKKKKKKKKKINFIIQIKPLSWKNSSFPVLKPLRIVKKLALCVCVCVSFSTNCKMFKKKKYKEEQVNLDLNSLWIVQKPEHEEAKECVHFSLGMCTLLLRVVQLVVNARLSKWMNWMHSEMCSGNAWGSICQIQCPSAIKPVQNSICTPSCNWGSWQFAHLQSSENKNVNGASEPIKTQTPGSTEQIGIFKCVRVCAPSKVLPAAVSFGANSTAPLSVDSHPSSVPSPPPSVPSVPTVVPSQPNEPILCRPAAGVPFQVTTSIAPAAAGPTVSMTQVISSPIAPLPVPVHPVNQPQMPLPQTLTPYQDLLYPGFPLNEKGECVSIPPYSYSKSGDDLPKDKGILQFFFNLGIKAYSCPMWAPHSYLYPLHQAYLNACRMYSSKVSSPVCHSGPWFQAPSSTPREASAVPVQMGGDLPHANEARLNGQYIDGGHGLASQSPEAAQSQGHQGSLDHSVSDPMQHSHMQPSHSGTGENSVLEERFLQPAFGHTPFIGGFQVAPAFTPPFWLGYPMQPFHEGMVAHNLRTYTEHEPKVADCPTVAPVDGDQCIASIPVDGTILQHQMKPEVESPVASRQQSQPSVGQVNETESAALSSAALDAGGSTTSIKKTGVPCVEGTDEPKDLQSTCKPESRVPVCKEELPKAESSEDEREVSEMLNRGRNKYYYSQNYVGRRGRNEKGHPFGRSGYPNSRAEEGRRGAQSKGMFYRDRDENRQSQHFRERGDARWKSREMYKAGKNV
uniref:OTU domain-containing protein 4 n=1 Tax=Latimeria chalumnae TaxID=7897 RepID=H3AYC4_LATCH